MNRSHHRNSSGNGNRRSRLRLNTSTRARLSFRQRTLLASLLVVVLTGGMIFVINLLRPDHTFAASSAGDYRSKTTGIWSAAGTWQKFDGTNWADAPSAPSSANGVITIQSGHTVTVNATVTVDQVVVASGGILTASGGTLTVANGTDNDLDVSGIANLNAGGTVTISAGAIINVSSGGTFNYNGGTETLTAGWNINNGGTYVHNVDGIDLPVATWGASSTLKITGVTTSDLKGTFQTFGNVIYNCPLQTASPLDFFDGLKAIAGDFTVVSTGTGGIWTQRISYATPIPIGGNYLQSGGTVYMTKGAVFTWNLAGNFTLTGGTFVEVERYGMPVLNVYGNFLITGGTFNHSTYLSALANEGIGIVNLYGNYSRTGGSHTETATLTGRGEYNFSKTGTQTFSASGGTITNTVNFTVKSGAILDLADQVITGGGSFTLESGGGLLLGSTTGITATTASGNVQVTGTRSFSTGGDYTYYATSAQVTGNGLPSTVHNITFDNASNVTLTNSSSATNLVTLSNGKVITNSNELGTTNTSPSAVTGHSSTRYVVGNLRRSVAGTGSYDFPVGVLAYYELANVNLTGMTGFTNILSYFTNYNPIEGGYPLVDIFCKGTPINDMLDFGYWALTPNSSMTGGTYAVSLKEQGHSNPGDPDTYCVIKRPGLSNSWQSIGTHTNSTQSESGGIATAIRSDLAAFSHFGIGKGGGPLPIELVYFKASSSSQGVACSWQTASEVNNDFFTLERSGDGVNFTMVAKINGAGTSSTSRSYSYTDVNPLRGLSYYRLKQTDYDGKFTYSQIETVKRSGETDEAMIRVKSVYPNPFDNSFKITFEAAGVAETNFILRNSSGQVIHQERIESEKGMNSIEYVPERNLEPGTYLVSLVSGNSRVSQKIIKN